MIMGIKTIDIYEILTLLYLGIDYSDIGFS